MLLPPLLLLLLVVELVGVAKLNPFLSCQKIKSIYFVKRYFRLKSIKIGF